VVGHAVNGDHFMPVILYNACNVFVQLFFP